MRHENGVSVDLAHPFCEMRVEEESQTATTKGATILISWGS
jgi:hypothetical protein